jgi:hypothetical protein
LEPGYLLHGNVAEAARQHLVALIGAPFAWYALIQWTGQVCRVEATAAAGARWVRLTYAAA